MNDKITLAHGAGGKQTSELIGGLFKKYFDNPNLTADDAAVLTPPAGRMAMSTDGFIVSPAFFPGGNIGKLSICGTVNDLACMGAKPLYISCACVIEEGFPMDTLEEIVKSMAETAAKVGVQIVSGDTKVAGKGQVDGIFITTTGVGEIMPKAELSGAYARPGDAITSDCASVASGAGFDSGDSGSASSGMLPEAAHGALGKLRMKAGGHPTGCGIRAGMR